MMSLEPEFQSIKRIEDYSGYNQVINHEKPNRFKKKVLGSLPKGRLNFGEQISFLERIISHQDKIHDLHNAYTRRKSVL